MANSARQLVQIVSEMNQKVLTVENGESKPGARIVMGTPTSKPSMHQLWYEDEKGIIRSALNDYAMEARFSGDQFVIMPFMECNPHQQWAFHGSKITKINLPPDCLDINKSDDKDGALVIEYVFSNTPNQQWHVRNIMPGQ